MRKTAEAESLTENHTTFIIRTIWIATLISVLSLTAGSAYMLPQIDYTAFAPCAESLATKGPEFAQNASFEEVYAAAQPCMHLFIDVNLRLLTITALIVALPIIFYLIFRYVRGLSRAAKGYRIANPRSWL
ncbi:MAG: hypothetical protein LRZ85_03555 [Alphaproteobacteria bacterium]|nr:hypothetical protein [Alphaproteobacteria bacterium]